MEKEEKIDLDTEEKKEPEAEIEEIAEETVTKEKTQKINKKKKSKLSDWFLVGSVRRICMVLLSYILLLSCLGSSFITAVYFYWFGMETASSYQETERFQKRIQSQIKNVVPALRQYLQQGTIDNDEMVEIYTMAEENREEGVINSWRKTASYTSESGAGIAGFTTGINAKGPKLYYEKQSDKFSIFQFTNGYGFKNFTDNHFIKRWEEHYYNREYEGIQRYIAIDSDTIKEWILKYGNNRGSLNLVFSTNLPDDIQWITCDYGSNESNDTILCYSESKDRWYYLEIDNYDNNVEKKAFHMPSNVYFPLYSIEEENKNNGQALIEFSNGFQKAELCLNNGLLYQKSKPKKTINGQMILKMSPFFNLKTVLYEAGKDYYYQKMLLQYINRTMDGYLWEFYFHGNSENTRVAIEEIKDNDNCLYYEEFFINYGDEQKENSLESILTGLGEQQGYHALTLTLAIPKSSVMTAEILSGTPREQIMRHYLERMIFHLGYQKVGLWIALAILCLIGYGYILMKLLFAKSRKENTETIVLAKFDYVPTEISIFIAGILAILALILYHEISYHSWAVTLLLFYLDCTFVYFLCYITAVSLIRRIRAKILWKNSLIVRAVTWVWKKGNLCLKGIWNSSGWKRKTVMLLSGYLIGSIFCGGGTIISFIIMDYTGDGFIFIFSVFLLILFIGLQIKAVSYVIRNEIGTEQILRGIKELSLGNLEYEMNIQGLSGEYLEMANTLPKIRDGLNTAIQKSLRNERMKTELITNVSHDIKTPLTSIINYIDLLKRANPKGENVDHYLEVLTQKSERLRHLIEDLVEASKASSGTLPLDKKNLNFIELIQQVMGEFEEKLSLRGLLMVIHYPEMPVMIFADGQRMFRIMENLFQNLYKYALDGTRVYLDLEIVDSSNIGFDKKKEQKAVLTLRNISAAPLNISEEELTERFVRGEESRTTEGSGLGLSITKDLVKLQGGRFCLKIDGDLFKVIMEFPIVEINSGIK